jgi:hypothetical protein
MLTEIKYLQNGVGLPDFLSFAKTGGKITESRYQLYRIFPGVSKSESKSVFQAKHIIFMREESYRKIYDRHLPFEGLSSGSSNIQFQTPPKSFFCVTQKSER